MPVLVLVLVLDFLSTRTRWRVLVLAYPVLVLASHVLVLVLVLEPVVLDYITVHYTMSPLGLTSDGIQGVRTGSCEPVLGMSG